LTLQSAGTTAITVDTSQNVGIGTATPDIFSRGYGRIVGINDIGSSGAALEINSASSYPAIELGRGGVRKAFFTAQSTVTEFGNLEAVPLTFFTNSAERARIDSSGNLLVGATSTFTTGAVNATQISPSGVVGISTASDAPLYISRRTTDGAVVVIRRDTTQVGSISVTTTATAYNTSSDYRLKDVTGPVTGAKDFIMALKPKQGTWKADGSKFVGFLAHEFQEISPSSVTGEKDAVDADGKPIMQSMQASSSEVIANLVAHIQNLETRLAALESA
jgi:hypothetical protein